MSEVVEFDAADAVDAVGAMEYERIKEHITHFGDVILMLRSNGDIIARCTRCNRTVMGWEKPESGSHK